MDVDNDLFNEEVEDTPEDGDFDPRISKSAAPEPTEKENEEDAEESEETEDEGTATEEPAKEEVRKVETPTVDVGLKAPQLTVQQKYDMEYVAAVKHILQHNNVPFKADGSDLQIVLDGIGKNSVSSYNSIIDYAKNHARQVADKYNNEEVEPYKRQLIDNQISQFCTRITKQVPDLKKYIPKMRQVYETTIKTDYPELINNPIMAIPFMILLAKQEDLKAVAAHVGTKKATLEKGAAQRIKGASVKRNKADSHLDTFEKALSKPDSGDTIDLWSNTGS